MTNPPPASQLTINPSAVRSVALMLIRVLLIVITALGTLLAFVKTRDLAGLINWIKSEDFVAFLTALGLLASFGSSVWVTLSRKWREVYLARNVDDRIAVVVEPVPGPSVETLPIPIGATPPAPDED